MRDGQEQKGGLAGVLLAYSASILRRILLIAPQITTAVKSPHANQQAAAAVGNGDHHKGRNERIRQRIARQQWLRIEVVVGRLVIGSSGSEEGSAAI